MWDVLITGGGLGGAILARSLARKGKRVLLVEKSAKPAVAPRPEALWPRSVELLRSLLPEARLEREAFLPLRGVDWIQGDKTHHVIGDAALRESGVQPISTNPAVTRTIALDDPEFDLRRGVEVTGLLREGTRVTGVQAKDQASGMTMDLAARWVVGDDGGHSVIREACGIGLETRLFPIEFLCFPFEWPTNWPTAVARLFGAPTRGCPSIALLGAMPLPEGHGAGLVLVLGDRFGQKLAPAEEWETFARANPEAAGIVGARRFPEDFVRIKRPYGHAQAYGAPGCVLMGDAIHPVSPAGGQGTNMSLADARALAEFLAEDGDDVPARYEARRRPANERSLGITEAAAKAVALGESVPGLGRAGLGLPWLLSKMPWVAARLLRQAAGAFDDGQ